MQYPNEYDEDPNYWLRFRLFSSGHLCCLTSAQIYSGPKVNNVITVRPAYSTSIGLACARAIEDRHLRPLGL
jgi:hypothetical protein